MFSLKIVDTDAFLEMPISSQLLYFHLAMRADDDGFISNPKKIMRFVGTQEDDYKVLIAKRFIIPFESGVCVVKHWRIHNYIQSDRYTETTYLDEKKRLIIKENGAYTECIQDVSKPEPQVRLGKGRIGKDREEVGKATNAAQGAAGKATFSQLGAEVIQAFEELNPVAHQWYNNTTQRGAADRLIETHGLETVLKVVALLQQTNKRPYMPSITTPRQLEEKWAELRNKLEQEKAKGISKSNNYVL